MAPYQKTNASIAHLCALAFAGATAQQPSFKRACRAEAAEQRRLVGLGRLELPTSRLSSARSNQLSYKPLTRGSRSRAPASRRRIAQAQPLARVRPRRKRNVDGEIPPMELNNPDDRWPLMFQKRFDKSKLLKNHP